MGIVQLSVPCGEDRLPFEVQDTSLLGVLDLKAAKAPDEAAEIERALRRPTASPRLSAIAKRDSTVAVVVNDATRPTPTEKLLNPLLRELKAAGVKDDKIRIVVASGLHPPTTKDELHRILGAKALNRFEVVVHDADDEASLVPLGETRRGTPIALNKALVDADLRVLTGSVEPHQLAGFTGGVKSLLPGLAGREGIERNHALLLDPRTRLGVLSGNPLREDIDEVCERIGVHFILNVVLNQDKQIVRAAAGDAIRAHRAVVAECQRLVRVYARAPADVVIASAGGHPKDIDLYQAQKALAHAEPVLKPGGTVILVAQCPRGVGDPLFQQWMTWARKPSDIIERLEREGFKMGAHKAYLLARSMIKSRVILVSGLPDRLVEEMHLTPAKTVQEALQLALAEKDGNARVAVMPHATSVLASPKRPQGG